MTTRFSLLGERRERRGNSVDAPVDELNRQLVTEPHEEPLHLFFGPRPDAEKGDRPVLHSERKIHKTRAAVWMESVPKEDDSGADGVAPFVRRGSFNARVQAVGKYWGSKVLQAVGVKDEPAVHPDSFCDGCGMDPIVGDMFTCSTCTNYNLCQTCYKNGVHGFENSKLLKKVKDDYTVETMFENSKHRVPEEVFTELLHNVCHGQVDKFKFLANWICGVVNGYTLPQLAVRGIEIPHLHPSTRARLVSLLTPPLTERQDMEVSMEWFVPPTEPDRETLRIWVCTDKDTKSPWAPKKPGSTSPIVYSPVMGPAHDPTENSIYSPPLLSPANAPSGHPPSPSRLNLTLFDIHAANGDDHEDNEEHNGSNPQAHGGEKEPRRMTSPIPKSEIRHKESLDGPCTPRFPDHEQSAEGETDPLPLKVVAVHPVDIHTPHTGVLAHDSF
ncbi:hypothetical protein LEN26_013390 [Aphanomyces euteiches]|nr:hypothetical protein LEN26_013390 [Aphanomyces euteiches]KAH9121238.1 hypothetical protein AeMF1_006942 [Aphanomyces euteiches]KAH9182112.1 hypothetical protein AeNC1_015913 [Aphanomyces euteiches]